MFYCSIVDFEQANVGWSIEHVWQISVHNIFAEYLKKKGTRSSVLLNFQPRSIREKISYKVKQDFHVRFSRNVLWDFMRCLRIYIKSKN